VLSHRISGWRGVFTKLEYLILNQLRQHRRPPINFRSGAGGKKSKIFGGGFVLTPTGLRLWRVVK
jgi:hypothetical protein